MNQTDNVVKVLSEKLAGSKLKAISIKHNPSQKNHSLITFIFNIEGEDSEHRIGIYGEGLSVSFGNCAP